MSVRDLTNWLLPWRDSPEEREFERRLEQVSVQQEHMASRLGIPKKDIRRMENEDDWRDFYQDHEEGR